MTFNIPNGLSIGIIKKTIKELEKTNYHPFKIGACVFKSGRIISIGHNSRKRPTTLYPKYQKYDTIHAEQDAILGTDWKKLKGCSILVLRTTHRKKLGMSYPCKNCIKLINLVGIKKIYYSDRNGIITMEKI